ncbi:uncharacterized protein OCT59_014269 [Rhizophagus irregularis]|uniref:Uncharacterized protein n=1 Tax=Rhizophagus irregularis TaxID=588596 RepID=A0A916EA27_9GLOM|nr:hypothetical protein OCT59_014269 [Rhizophagus irregularis]CAB4480742.1 unnamed protein product [Rhizophagus irregularis]CAB5179232.1 unnamed protein product [Rhizophagus irregularis]CAB5371242.1 unnamed protein product [Rhizophagus irregularis]CAB5386978.1 unnamed protein product [Rhizophagus irregularis]
MIGEVILPPPPYSEKDNDDLIALKESLPSPYNECDIKNNVQDDESSWFKNFVKEVEVIVDMAAKAHQAAVERLANLVDMADKKKIFEEEEIIGRTGELQEAAEEIVDKKR